MNPLLRATTGDDSDDIEGLAKSVGVLRLTFIATCALCGPRVADGQVMTR